MHASFTIIGDCDHQRCYLQNRIWGFQPESHPFIGNNSFSKPHHQQGCSTFKYESASDWSINPDGTFTSTEYNKLGQVKAEVDAKGNRTEYEYDDAGRKTVTRNALLQETITQYDGVGNVTHVTGPNGETVEYLYDDLNRKTETIYPDEISDYVDYDKVGRVVKKTDRNGIETVYDYDSLGRLTKVFDALLNETSYTYDERGRKLTETDAELQTTEW